MKYNLSPVTDSTVPFAVTLSRIFSGLRMVLIVLGVTEEISTLWNKAPLSLTHTLLSAHIL